MTKEETCPRPGYHFIYVKSFRHHRTKKVVRAKKGSAIRLEVKD